MRVNGVEASLGGDFTLKRFLESEGYDLGRIAVEKNGVIVSRARYETEVLIDDDRLEIVSFVGGG